MSETTERAPRADGADFLTGHLADQHLSAAAPLPWLSTAKDGKEKDKTGKKVQPDKPVDQGKPAKKADEDPHRISARCP